MLTRNNVATLILLLIAAGCKSHVEVNIAPPEFANARKVFVTKITRPVKWGGEPDKPPAGLFNLIKYPAPIGNMDAYVGHIPQDGKLHPAIIWIIGGFGNGIGDEAWKPGPPGNDQSGSVFWKAGLTVMYVSQRGGNTNPGSDECFYGEIDDIIAAAKYLAKQPGIDPGRIYLGGHSTGGTKTILAAEACDMFRATFSFGAVASVGYYGSDYATFDTTSLREYVMRAPVCWLASLKKPIFIFDGVNNSNIESLRYLKDSAAAQHITIAKFYEINNADHFTVLQPVSKIIAQKIIADSTGNVCNITFDSTRLNDIFKDVKGGE